MDQPSTEPIPGPSDIGIDISKEKIIIYNKHETIASGSGYGGSGIKTSLHGTIYQIKLLMLFLHRGLKRGYHFSLGTEVDEAEKFDDLVFSYDNANSDGKVYRFLQAKHKQCESKTIKCDDLLNDSDDDFSLLKYFISYRKIIQNATFKGELEEFIICTNINLDKKVLKSDEKNVIKTVYEIDSAGDHILGYKNYSKSKLYKFTKHSEFYKKLKSSLKKTHADKLATKLAKMVMNKEKSLPKDELLKCYRGWLLNKLFIIETDSNGRYLLFGDEFLQDQCDEALGCFRQTFMAALEKSNPKDNVENILRKTKFKIPETFAVEAKQSLSLDVTDEEIDDFLDKIILAVNQPNEIELQSIITDEIGKDMNFINGEFIANRLLGHVLDWAKERQGHYLTFEDGQELFKHLKQSLARIGLVGLTLAYKAKISKGYSFKDNVQVIETVRNFLQDKNKQLLTIYFKSQLLSSIKILQANTNNEVDASIFCDLKTFQSLIETEACPIDAFKSEAHYYLIIDNITKVHDITEIVKAVSGILKQNPNKRVILNISHEVKEISENILDKFLKDEYDNEKCITIVDENNNFCDLVPESQKKLLEESIVIFQGNEANLSSVIDEHSDLISGEILSKLISHDKIEIGEAPATETYRNFREYFVARKSELQREYTRVENDVKDFLHKEEGRAHREYKRIEKDVKTFLNKEEVRAPSKLLKPLGLKIKKLF